MEFFATCPTGFERLLADELEGIGVQRVRPLRGQVAFFGDLEGAYRVCLWSRLASRVVAVVARVDAADADALYEGVSSLPWEDHLGPTTSFLVDASGGNDQLRTSQFTSLRVKDAVVDRMRSRTGVRPSVSTSDPDLRITAHVGRSRATIGIDLVGTPLFRRGYEPARATGGLRADYACALLALARWKPEAGEAARIVDMTPGQGTILVEAALVAAHRAPGLLRARWGFEGWRQHDPAAWGKAVEDARGRAAERPACVLAVPQDVRPPSKALFRAAGMEAQALALGDFAAEPAGACDLLVCDLTQARPEDVARQAHLLSSLARLSSELAPHRVATVSRDLTPQSALRREAAEAVESRMGKAEAWLWSFDRGEGWLAPRTVRLPDGTESPVLVAASDQFAARLRKNARARRKWARREDVSCYRVYDADLPDYAVTVDLYQGVDAATGSPNGERWLQVSEYAPPKDVDPALAQSRLLDALSLAPAILDVSPRHTYLRIRRRDRGGSQYAKEAREPQRNRTAARDRSLPPGAHLIDEGGLTFEVNFSQRLDCGIFLDHRTTRGMLRELAKQTKGSKRFLNLFAYTGTATCYAADGGMAHTTTVDLSRPSLDWARRNMARNGFAGPAHEFVQADVVRWVSEQRHTRNRWDLVFCDVPTFSNSSRMGRRSFDVQRDHAELVIGVSRLLTRGGTGIFSCNLRGFKPDVEKLRGAGVELEDITAQTIPEDFARNPRVHAAFLFRRTA